MHRQISKLFLVVCLFVVGLSFNTATSQAAAWELITENPSSINLKQFTVDTTRYNYKLVLEGNIDEVIFGYTATDDSFNGLLVQRGPGPGNIAEYNLNTYITNPAQYHGIRIWGLATGAKASMYRQIKNINPILTLTNNGNISLYNDGGTFTITGTVRDPDNDPITVSATVGGVTKTTSITNTLSNVNWSLSWSGTEIPVGTYSVGSIVVSADDSKDVITQVYQGTLTISPQIYYYWSKYNVIDKYLNPRWIYQNSNMPTHDGVWGYTDWTYDPLNGFRLVGEYKQLTQTSGYLYADRSMTSVTRYGYGYPFTEIYNLNYNDLGTPTKFKGTILQSNIKAIQNTYPDDGLHSDGFWYTRTGSVPNNSPIGTVNQINQKPISSQQTFNMTGTASDPDGDTLLIQATLGGVTKQASLTNTQTTKNWTLTWNKDEVPDGIYSSISVIISDGK